MAGAAREFESGLGGKVAAVRPWHGLPYGLAWGHHLHYGKLLGSAITQSDLGSTFWGGLSAVSISGLL